MLTKIVTSKIWFVGWAVAILAIQLFQGFSSAAYLVKACSVH